MIFTKFFQKIADTSRFAYQATPNSVRDQHKKMIMNKIEELGTATCDELEACLQLPHQSASARISELLKSNKILDTGDKRLTRSKRPARVYKLIKQEEGTNGQKN